MKELLSLKLSSLCCS